VSIDASLGGLAVRLWRAIGQARRRQFRLLLALMVLSSLAEVVTVGAVLPFLSALANPHLLLEHTALRPTLERLGVSTPADVILATTLAFCAAVVFAGVVRILVLRLSLGYAFGLGADISNDVFRRTLHQPYSVHIARNSSEVINGIAIKTSEVIFYVIAPAMTLFSSAFMAVAILATLAAIIPASALAAFGVFGVLYALMMRTLRHGLRANSDRIARESTNTIRYLQEGLGGIRDILLDRTQDTFVATFQRSDAALRKAQCENQFVSQSPRFLMESTGMVLIALIALGFSRGDSGVAGVVPTDSILPSRMKTGALVSVGPLTVTTIPLVSSNVPARRAVVAASRRERRRIRFIAAGQRDANPYTREALRLKIFARAVWPFVRR
jgi:ATP-binding cassette subfamily B protein